MLPGNAYALAFVRTYAKALGLDAEEMVRRFKTEAAEVSRRAELIFPVPMPERGLPAGAVVLLGLVLAIGAYAGWYRLSGEGRLPAETVTAIPERLASLAEQAVPPPPAPASGPAAPAAPAVPAAGPLAAASANADREGHSGRCGDARQSGPTGRGDLSHLRRRRPASHPPG